MLLLSSIAIVFASLALFGQYVAAFNPYEFDRKAAQCTAVRRGAQPSETTIYLSEFHVCLCRLVFEMNLKNTLMSIPLRRRRS